MVVAAVPMPPPIPMRPRITVLESRPEFLAKYMPAIFRPDPFMQRLLRMFDEMLRPALGDGRCGRLLFRPLMTPPAFVEWLAAWVGEAGASALPGPVPARAAPWSARPPGSAARVVPTPASSGAVELVAGCEALVIDNTEGLRLDEDGRLGVNTALQAARTESNTAWSTGQRGGHRPRGCQRCRAEVKPAHCVFSVELADACRVRQSTISSITRFGLRRVDPYRRPGN